MSKYDDIAHDILDEVDKAVKKFPTWPTDMQHAALVVGEENGELQKSVLQFHYEKHKGVHIRDIRAEAIQTAAMAIRFVASLDRKDYVHPELVQHKQDIDEDL